MSSERHSVVREMRRTRQRRRLGDTEWFDLAYRVYLFGLSGLVAVVWLSDLVDGVIGDDVTGDDLLTRGPSVLGIAAVLAVAAGLRSGANGGPVSIEVADVRHVLLAPIDRRAALLRPVVQRMRSAAFAVGLAGGVLGQFVGREVEGSRAAWAWAGVAFGATIGASFVATAVLAHALRLPRWAATAAGASLVAWQSAVAWQVWNGDEPATGSGPADTLGDLAFWGIRQDPVDLVALGAVVAAAAVALWLCGRLRVEPLAERGALVSQLRFAATAQDLRTVVLLRRQLRSETLRTLPWGRRRRAPSAGRRRPMARSGRPDIVVIAARGVRSLRRLPASRLGRIIALAVAAGVSAALAVESSLLFLLALLVAVFLLGLESLEPLSQEVDRPDITDSLPVDRGTLYAMHLVAPAGLLTLAALVGAGAATVMQPAHAAAAFAVAVPVAWLGALGPIVSTVGDASSPIGVADTTITGAARNQDMSMMPAEFAGFGTAISTALPVILSATAVLPVLAMRALPEAGTAVRVAIGTLLAMALLVVWVRRRDTWSVRIRGFFQEGRELQSSGAQR